MISIQTRKVLAGQLGISRQQLWREEKLINNQYTDIDIKFQKDVQSVLRQMAKELKLPRKETLSICYNYFREISPNYYAYMYEYIQQHPDSCYGLMFKFIISIWIDMFARELKQRKENT